MKSFLATTAIVLLMGGSAYAAPAQFNTYQSKATDIDASKFIGQTVYASKTDVTPDQKVTADAQKDWDNIGDINELVLSKDGSVKAVVIGVGGFLGMGEKNVALDMKDIKFVKTGDGPDDYSLVINSTKEALNAAPAYNTPDDVKAAMNAAKTTTDTAANPALTTPGLTTPADNDTAANTTTTTDMAKPADTAKDTAADTTMEPADATKDQASSTAMTTDKAADTAAANTEMAKPADTAKDQASDNSTANTDTTTTASTTNNDNAVTTTMNDNRTRLTPPTVTRDGYAAAKVEELTSDKLEGATVYGPKDEDVGKVNKLVMNDNGKGIKLFVLDVGGFLGIGAHQIAVTPQELDIVRNAKGDDVRVYIDANKDVLKAQPEYKMQ